MSGICYTLISHRVGIFLSFEMPQVLTHRVLLLESMDYVVVCMFVFVRRGRAGGGLFTEFCGSPVLLLSVSFVV